MKLIGSIDLVEGKVPVVSTKLNTYDYWGAIKVRWGIKRDSFKIEPGLYAVGKPDKDSDVLVTGNYKLSFDHLRKNLDGINAWILVLDTKGVNVWCAAGKGTFSTAELVKKIQLCHLHSVVDHRRIIVPQLGATGIAAHEVKRLTTPALGETLAIKTNVDFNNLKALKKDSGFRVIYGPVRAADLKEFITNGYKASPNMREVKFGIWDRMKLIPNDFKYGMNYLGWAAILFFLISVIGKWNAPFSEVFNGWLISMICLVAAYAAGIVLTPIFLPYIPVKRFALKGIIVSALVSLGLWYFNIIGGHFSYIISWLLINAGVASFMAMNFTGSSTYTSLSGVQKEMKFFVPVQIACAFFGLVLMVFGKIFE